MFTYEEFRDEVIRRIKDFMGKEYESYSVKTVSLMKRGRMRDGFTLKADSEKFVKMVCAPTLYFDDLYKLYTKSEDIDHELETAARVMINGFKEGRRIMRRVDLKHASDRIVFQLFKRDGNEEFLDMIPHRPFLDMEIIYRWIISTDNNMITSALIDNDISFAMGLDEERLYELAKRNTPMILPMNIRGIDGTDYRQSGIIFATNSCFSIGAGVILYDNMLADLASEFGTDLYVMPNTVDESIIISGEMGFVVPDLHSHFLEAADSIFTPEERLSDIVYRFDAGKNKLVRASLKSLKTCKGDS